MALQPLPKIGIVREVYESAIHMSRRALLSMDIDADRVAALVADFRERDLRRLVAQKESGDMKAGMDMVYGANFAEELDEDGRD